MAFEENIYNGDPIKPKVAQLENLIGPLPETALVDRGCKGHKSVLGVNIKVPSSKKGRLLAKKKKERFRRRA